MRAIWTSSARDLVADPTREGWAALALCVILGVGVDLAFDMLTGHTTPRPLTDEDYEAIEDLRLQGMTWSDIGLMYGRERTAIHNATKRHRAKLEKKEIKK